MSVRDLETEVAKLAPDELAAFAQWFEEYVADAWDHRIEEDIRAGRLDEAGKQADADFEAGRREPQEALASFGQRFAQFKGAALGLPPDMAEQHDRYRLGTPKR